MNNTEMQLYSDLISTMAFNSLVLTQNNSYYHPLGIFVRFS